MKVVPLLFVVALVCSCSGGSESTPSAEATGTATDTRSLNDLLAVAELLPVSLEPTRLVSDEDPPRVVMRVGVTFQTMDAVVESIDTAVTAAGFTKSDGDELIWTNANGIRIEAPGRPTLLTIHYDE